MKPPSPPWRDRVVKAAAKIVLEPDLRGGLRAGQLRVPPEAFGAATPWTPSARRSPRAGCGCWTRTSRRAWMHRHTAPLADCLDQNRLSCGVWGLDTQAFPASGADVDGVEFAALDTLHQGLAGDAVGEGGLEHRQPAFGGVVDEQRADVVGEADAPGRAGGELLAGDEPVAEPAVQGGRWRVRVRAAASATVSGSSSLWGGAGLVAGDVPVVAQCLDPTGGERQSPVRWAGFAG